MHYVELIHVYYFAFLTILLDMNTIFIELDNNVFINESKREDIPFARINMLIELHIIKKGLERLILYVR